jgi:hypothetical protein
MTSLDQFKFFSRFGTTVLIGFISLLFMYKLITVGIGLTIALAASTILHVFSSLLALNLEESNLWQAYIKEFEKDWRKSEEDINFVNNHWKSWLVEKE